MFRHGIATDIAVDEASGQVVLYCHQASTTEPYDPQYREAGYRFLVLSLDDGSLVRESMLEEDVYCLGAAAFLDGGGFWSACRHDMPGYSDQGDFLRRYDAAGSLAEEYALPGVRHVAEVRSLPDGRLLLAGSRGALSDPPAERHSVWLAEVSPDGTIERDASVGDNQSNNGLASALPLPDGGFLLVIRTQGMILEDGTPRTEYGCRVVRVDADLGIVSEWSETFPEAQRAEARTPWLTGDGEEIVLPVSFNLLDERSDDPPLRLYWLDPSDDSVLRTLDVGGGDWVYTYAEWPGPEGGLGVAGISWGNPPRILQLDAEGASCSAP